MELKGRYRFSGPASRVWDLLMDAEALAACLPGCERFEPIGDDRYRVLLNARVAAVSGSFEGTVTIAEREPPHRYQLTVEGRGRPGYVKGASTIALKEEGEVIVVEVSGDAQVGGLIAQVGQRLIGATAKMMMDRFFQCLMTR